MGQIAKDGPSVLFIQTEIAGSQKQVITLNSLAVLWAS